MTPAAVSLLGYVFWLLVARIYTPTQVGLATALISSAGLVGTFSKLGLDFSLIRYLPMQKDKKGTLDSSFTIVALFCLAVSLVFIVGLRFWSPKLSFVQTDPVLLAAFLVFTPLYSLTMLQHAAFVGLRSAKYSLFENALMGLAKLPLPLVFLSVGLTGIVLSWGLSIVVGAGVALAVFLPRLVPGYSPRPTIHSDVVRSLARFSAGNYVADIADSLPGLLFPLIIVNVLTPDKNAYFFMAWMVSGVLSNIPLGTNTSLLAEGSYEPQDQRTNVVRTLKFTFALLIPSVIIVLLLAGPVLRILGPEYSRNAPQLLRLLALSSLPLAVVRLYVTRQRIRSKLAPVIIIYVVGAASVLTLSYLLLPVMGLNGIGVAWLTTQTASAFVAGWLLIRS